MRTGLLLSCSNTIELWGQSGIVFIHSKTNMHFIQWDAHWSSLKFKIPLSTQRLYCLHYFKMRGLKDWVTRPIKQLFVNVGLVLFGNTVLPCRSTDTTPSFFFPPGMDQWFHYKPSLCCQHSSERQSVCQYGRPLDGQENRFTRSAGQHAVAALSAWIRRRVG